MSSKYHRVAVLAIVWEKGDPMFQQGHDHELQNLRSSMQNDFGYEHTEFRIPSEGGREAQHHVNKAISDHIEQHDGPGSPLIIYYSGQIVVFRQ
ncbi:hypothetical protein E8E11_000711 [Didymella keratinophila]|nr:hypothetical protein E8E11_000711 [Didymella keratinophila]